MNSSSERQVLADARNSGRIGSKLLHCNDGAALNGSLGDHKRVGIFPAFEKLLLLNVLLEMRHSVDSGDKLGFGGCWRCK